MRSCHEHQWVDCAYGEYARFGIAEGVCGVV
jgi:hypothetical protein